MYSRRSYALRLCIICFVGGIYLSFLFSSHAFAFSEKPDALITAVSQSQKVNFPKGIDFQLRATDDTSPITKAMIEIQYGDFGFQTHNVTIKTPSTDVTLLWQEKIENKKFIVPGIQVSYQWTLEDAVGTEFTTGIERFTLMDTRFTWQTVSQGLINLHWYDQPTSFGQELLNQASEDIERVSANLDSKLNRQISIWIYLTEKDYNIAVGEEVGETSGVAFPWFDETFFFVEDLQDSFAIEGTMPHELTHLLLHQAVGENADFPIWFDEGLATYQETIPSRQLKNAFNEALEDDTLLRLSEIDYDYPDDPDKFLLLYAQSVELIDYMYKTYGDEKMVNLIDNMAITSTDFDEDLSLSLGVDTAHLENEWRISLGEAPTLTGETILSTPTPKPTIQPTQPPIQQPTPPVSNDTMVPVLLVLGSILILFAVGVSGGVIAYQMRSKRKARIEQEVRHVVNSAFTPAMPPVPAGDYANPAWYVPMARGNTNMPDEYGEDDLPFVGSQEYVNFTPGKKTPQD